MNRELSPCSEQRSWGSDEEDDLALTWAEVTEG